ncbi:hypothetical protein CVT24_007668 [Panaeolus cyanescens]|uniref:AMP-dependent synthetase/ligase domain-containing protein n=1 Tax=Panaeolus cyanescens TaxID=181874 RepID=A0A409VRN6_9AGAR|nr:hypothetical protein CVT24_007668 [Panaeolus cyanescens]
MLRRHRGLKPAFNHVSLSGSKATRFLTKSSVQGPLDPPLSHKTLPHYFTDDILAKHSSRPALICRKEDPRAHGGPLSPNLGISTHLAWDYEEFNRHIMAVARGLLGMGVQKGDRVGVIMGNNSAYATLQWACASIGAILVTLNPAYRLVELVSTLKLAGVKHLFVVPSIRSSQYVRMLSQAFVEIRGQAPGNLQVEDLPEWRNLVVVDNKEEARRDLEKLHIKGMVDWREVLIWRDNGKEAAEQKKIVAGLDKDDIINLQFTSGTTGNLAAWSQGSCIVYPSEIFDPVAIVDAVQDEKCTALHGVPTHFLGVLTEVEHRKNHGIPVDMRSLRTGIAAGSPIPIDLMKRLISDMNLTDLTNAYGMTETSPVSFQTTPSDPIIKRVETVGKVQPHVKAKIVDPEGNVVDVNTPGEIWVAGYLLQKGYWEDKEQTDLVMKKDEEGTLWMHTGDEGIMDEDGYLRMQIENAITLHPAVREAAAVAVPDAKYGEVVGAWIVREPNTPESSPITREQLREMVSRNMNPQNAPAWVWFIGEDGNPDELPKTASGKVMKHVLRKWSKQLAEEGVGRV